jgi:hypothetical protein
MSITSSKISFGTHVKAHIVANCAARHLRLKTTEITKTKKSCSECASWYSTTDRGIEHDWIRVREETQVKYWYSSTKLLYKIHMFMMNRQSVKMTVGARGRNFSLSPDLLSVRLSTPGRHPKTFGFDVAEGRI